MCCMVCSVCDRLFGSPSAYPTEEMVYASHFQVLVGQRYFQIDMPISVACKVGVHAVKDAVLAVLVSSRC